MIFGVRCLVQGCAPPDPKDVLIATAHPKRARPCDSLSGAGHAPRSRESEREVVVEDFTLNLRTFLAIRTMEITHCDWETATGAVARTMNEHPEWSWDLTERRTFGAWEAEMETRGTTR